MPVTLLDLSYETFMLIVECQEYLQDVLSFAFSNKRCYYALRWMIYKCDAKSFQPRALLWAAVHGNKELLKEALDAGTDIDTQFSRSFSLSNGEDFGQTPILAAASAGHTEIVRYLLDAGADPRGFDHTGLNALHCAAERGHEEIVRILLRHSPSLLYDIGRGSDGLPAAYAADRKPIFRLLLEAMDTRMCASSLILAMDRGYYDICEWLVRRGVSLDYDKGLLSFACRGGTDGHIKTMQFLIEHAKREELDLDFAGISLYSLCLANGPRVLEVVKLLLEHGSETNCESGIDMPLAAACQSGNFDVANLLLSKAETPTKSHNEEIILAVWAALCKSPNIECSGFVLKHFPIEMDTMGTNLLIFAAKHKNKNSVKLLLGLGAKANGFGDMRLPGTDFYLCRWDIFIGVGLENLCPLKVAWEEGSAEIIKLLLDAGAKPEAIDPDGFPILTLPFRTAVDEEKHLSCLELLLEAGADPRERSKSNHTPLHAACLSGAVACTRLLLDRCKEEDITVASKTDRLQPIHAAVKSGKLEIVKMLVGKGANVRDTYADDCTTLHDACRLQHPDEMVEYLLSQKVNPNLESTRRDWGERSYYGRQGQGWPLNPKPTPFLCLLENNEVSPSPRVLELLLSHSTLDQKNDALVTACMNGHFAAVRMLLERKVDPNVETDLGIPLLCAARHYHLDIMRLLIKRGAKIDARDRMAATLFNRKHPAHGGILKLLFASVTDLKNAEIAPDDFTFFYAVRKNIPWPPEYQWRSVPLVAETLLARTNNRRAVEIILDEGGFGEIRNYMFWQEVLNGAATHELGNLIRTLVDKRVVTKLDVKRLRDERQWAIPSGSNYSETIDTIFHIGDQADVGDAA